MKYIKLSVLALATFAAVGCTRTDTDLVDTQNESRVNFVSEINGQAQVSSKATTPLPGQTRVVISVRNNSSAELKPFFLQSKPYRMGTTVVGLVPTPSDLAGWVEHDETDMHLPTGYYDFAAVAFGSWSNIIDKGGNETFTELYYGVSSGVDYLGAWVKSKTVSRNDEGVLIKLVFDHLATQIELTLIKDEQSLEALEVSQVEITPTQRLSSLTAEDLSGYLSVIGGAISIDAANIEVASPTTLVSMTKNELVFSHIVLPSSRTGELKMKITATVTLLGQTTPIAKVYEVVVPVSAESPLAAGKKHRYNATISASGITFNNDVTLEDWTAGNSEGEDLGSM